MTRPRRRIATGLTALSVAALAGVALTGAPSQAAGGRALNGTFKLSPGSYSGGKAHGTWFRMIISGSAAKKAYLPNPDSKAAS
jgi:hypothetical protein